MRRIYVGDVHGCLAELTELMGLVAPGPADVLTFVGDIVDRGPDTLGALRYVQRLVETGRAVCVAGNHEYKALRLKEKADEAGSWEGLTRARPWQREATEDDYAFLRRMPLVHRPPGADVLVVHGGLFPRFFQRHGSIGDVPAAWHRGGGKRMDRMRRFLRIRHVDDDGDMVSLGDEGPRTRHWSEWYDGREGWVFYGHDPVLGEPRRGAWCTGIDTGCVFGGSLTAAIVPEGTPPGEAEIVSVPAREVYAKHRRLSGGSRSLEAP